MHRHECFMQCVCVCVCDPPLPKRGETLGITDGNVSPYVSPLGSDVPWKGFGNLVSRLFPQFPRGGNSTFSMIQALGISYCGETLLGMSPWARKGPIVRLS